MLIDYRYHIGSFVAIFVALLLGILVGIGLAPNPDEFEDKVTMLKEEYRRTREAKMEELKALEEANRECDMLTRETVAAVIRNRLADKQIALILGRDFDRSPLPENLRAALRQAGANITSTTTVTREFVRLSQPIKQRVSERLSLYPPPGVHFRTVIAEAVAKDLAQGHPDLILDLHTAGLLKSTADSEYTIKPDAVVILGGMNDLTDAAPERIDLPIIQTLTEFDIRVVGVEAGDAAISTIPAYKAAGIPTVDNVDSQAGRLATILVLEGADGHYGTKESADSFLPPILSPDN